MHNGFVTADFLCKQDYDYTFFCHTYHECIVNVCASDLENLEDSVNTYLTAISRSMHDSSMESGCVRCDKPKPFWSPELSKHGDKKVLEAVVD